MLHCVIEMTRRRLSSERAAMWERTLSALRPSMSACQRRTGPTRPGKERRAATSRRQRSARGIEIRALIRFTFVAKRLRRAISRALGPVSKAISFMYGIRRLTVGRKNLARRGFDRARAAVSHFSFEPTAFQVSGSAIEKPAARWTFQSVGVPPSGLVPGAVHGLSNSSHTPRAFPPPYSTPTKTARDAAKARAVRTI